jgi:hypothetical protein
MHFDPATGLPLFTPHNGHPAIGCTPAIYKLTPCVAKTTTQCCIGVGAPTHYTIYLDGLAWCGCTRYSSNSQSITGTHLPSVAVAALVSGGAICAYQFNAAHSGATRRDWYNTTCSGDPAGSTGSTLCGVTLALTSTWWRVVGWIGFPGAVYVISTGQIARAVGCNDVLVGSAPCHILDPNGDPTPGSATSVVAVPGDQVTPGVRCPGGVPVFTDTAAFAAFVGKTVPVDDVCYSVSVATTGEYDPEDVVDLSGATIGDEYDGCNGTGNCCNG